MRLKKFIATLTSVIMLAAASAAPVSNISFAAGASNIISNSDFSSGTTGWGVYKESGGTASL